MKKKLIGEILIFSFIGILGLCVQTKNVNAASFDDAKEQVESGEALIFNPVSEGLLTQENSVEYMNLVEEESKNSTGEISDIMEQAYIDTADLDTIPVAKSSIPPLIMSRGANIPNNFRAIDKLPGKYHYSDAFSGTGWRYSGYKFYFENSAANPFFGIKTYIDSFSFYTNHSRYAVEPGKATVYFPARRDGYGLWGYFATYYPINGSKYYIF